jgi:hypothetical protein
MENFLLYAWTILQEKKKNGGKIDKNRVVEEEATFWR